MELQVLRNRINKKTDIGKMKLIAPVSVVKIVKSVTALLYNLTHGVNKCFN